MLEVFIKKYLWTANLVLLAFAAWLLARTVNTVVGAAIRPKPTVDLSALPTAFGRAPTPVSIDPKKLYPLIGLKAPDDPLPVDSVEAAAPKTCNDVMAPPTKSGLRAQMVAAIVSSNAEWSVASIIDLNSRETKIYGVGDNVLGSTLLSIERIHDDRDETGIATKSVAIICNNGVKEYVDFEPGDGSSSPPPSASSMGHTSGPAPDDDVGGAAGGKPMEGIRKLAENRYDVKRAVIDNTLSNLNNIATQARIVPSFKNGVSNGFKLFSIQPGSLYSSIGVENGDVITRINGYEINSPDKALEVYQKLKESNHVTIEVDRNGQMVKKDYVISP